MLTTRHSRFIFVLAVAALAAPVAVAQITTATIHGTVRDSSGASLPEVSVIASQPATGYTRTVTTGSDGTFVIPLLPVGDYNLTATKPGFSKHVERNIRLELNRNAQIDVSLNVGAVQESVTVSATAPLIDTRGGSLGEVVNTVTIRELPLNGRNPIQLAAFTAGVSTVSAPTILTQTGRSGGRLAVHGSRANENQYMLDGAYFNGMYQGTGMNYPSPDALQEFKLITNSFSAEYGRVVGAVFNAVTKSGTNDLHGGLWEFLRNDALNARNFFSATVPMLRQNQFGGMLGGTLKKDKLFFFTAYQGARVREDVIKSGFSLTERERQGFFSQPAGRVLRDPATNLPYPLVDAATSTYFVNPSTFDRVATRVVDTYVPITPTAAQVVVLAPKPSDNDHYLIKGDASLSSANRLTVTYFRDKTMFSDPAPGSTFTGFSQTDSKINVWSGTVSDTHVFSPAVLNEFRAHYLRDYNDSSTPNQTTLTSLGAVNFNEEGPPQPPSFRIMGRFNLGNTGLETMKELGYRYQLFDTVTFVRGRHELRFGGDILRSHWGIRSFFQAPGVFTFSGAFTRDPMVDFMLGLPSQVQRGSGIYKDHVSWSRAVFVQDEWRILPRLSLSLGLRYEINEPYASKDARGTVFRPGQRSTLVPLLPVGMVVIGDEGVPKGTFKTDTNNFGPRIGLAWDPFGSGKTSIRASGGIFYTQSPPDLTTQPGSNPPFATRDTLFSPPGGLSNPYLGFTQPFPYVPNLQNPSLALPQTILSIAGDYRDATVYSWMMSVQRQIINSWMFEAAYVGKSSVGLETTVNANPAVFIPGQSTAANINARRIYSPGVIGDVRETSALAHASYHGLDLTSRVRGSRLTMTNTYTWSKSIDEKSGFAANSLIYQNPFNRRAEKGPSDFDRRHVFATSLVYEMPRVSRFLGGHAAVGIVTDGWQISALTRAVSGPPFNIGLGFDNSLSGINLDRPNVVGDMELPGDRTRAEKIARWFNPGAFAAAPQGSFGNAGRNIGRGPGSLNTDLGIAKNFRMPNERWGYFQFRGELFNATNRVNLGTPNSTLNSGANFGRITSAGSARVAQFGIKYLF